jgi:hypothetical protein
MKELICKIFHKKHHKIYIVWKDGTSTDRCNKCGIQHDGIFVGMWTSCFWALR